MKWPCSETILKLRKTYTDGPDVGERESARDNATDFAYTVPRMIPN